MKKKVIYDGDFVTVRMKKKAYGKTGFYLDIAHVRKALVQVAAEKNPESGRDSMKNGLTSIPPGYTLLGLLRNRRERKLAEGKTSVARQLQNIITHMETARCDIRLDRLDRAWCMDFLLGLKGERKESTRHNYFLNLNASLNEAVADGLLKENPFRSIPARCRPHRQKAGVEYLESGEVRAMLDTEYRKDIKDFFRFLCYSGMRYGDAARLRWNDLHASGNGFVHIGFTAQKTGKRQSVYVPAEILPEKKDGDLVFSLPHPTNINRHLKKWAALAGVKKNVHLHTARHTFATCAVSRGIDLYVVSKLLGHSNISTTQIYAEVVDRKKMEAAMKMKDVF